jgi:3-isopropylmalate/(R)-2-methylmalate dehydratase large subunit
VLMNKTNTLYDKLIDTHTVCHLDDGIHIILYIDRQVINEYTSPQAFSGIREKGCGIHRSETHLAVVDHVNATTSEMSLAAAESEESGGLQINYLSKNCKDFDITLFDIFDARQGIEHVVAPEQGFILPGMLVAAGDSHTTTYGALGALGFGIGTSEIEHLLVTQTLVYKKLKSMRVQLNGFSGASVTSKDIIMHVIRTIGAGGATGYAVEFSGDVVDDMSIEARMTICNMIVEAGARGAIIAPDNKVFEYLKGKPFTPSDDMYEQAVNAWKNLSSDSDAVFDKDIKIDISEVEPLVTWGTSPDQVVSVGSIIPSPENILNPVDKKSLKRALNYMGLTAGQKVSDILISHAFIGSCTNARIEDLREVATILKGRKIHDRVKGIIVPGSMQVRAQAEKEGLAEIFQHAGFEWRRSGCSLCLAMNNDILKPNERCASSTNRNFEGRQGAGARTHLMSPVMVAAAAVVGRICDVRSLDQEIHHG